MGDSANFNFGAGVTYSGYFIANLDTSPLFMAPSGGFGTAYDGLAADWRLESNSPCINAGRNDSLGADLPQTDLYGNPRISYATTDIGAFEFPDTNTENIISKPQAVISIYPNPTDGLVNFIIPDFRDDVEIIIRDFTGSEINSGLHPSQGNFSIDLSHLAPGPYFILLIKKTHYESHVIFLAK